VGRHRRIAVITFSAWSIEIANPMFDALTLPLLVATAVLMPTT
jgi:hypothetical protein